MARARPRLLSSLGWRLFAAFTLVAVGAVGLLATVAVLSVEHQTTALADRQVARAERAIVRALSAAYARAGTWEGVDLSTVQSLAEVAGIRVLIVDISGGPVATVTPHDTEPAEEPSTATVTHHPRETTVPVVPPATPTRLRSSPTRPAQSGRPASEGDQSAGHAAHPGQQGANRWRAPPVAAAIPAPALATPTPTTTSPGSTADAVPIRVNGRRVGSVIFGGPSPADSATGRARTEILDAVWIGGALAVILAAAAALLVSRRISRPLAALVAATEAVERGVPDATNRLRAGPGEIGHLSRAFDRMAHTLHREDELRRALVADVAHELRTPVTILLGLTEELLDGLTEPTTQRLTSLHDEVLRLGRLVDDLAILSAAQAAGLTLQRRLLDLAKTAQQVMDMMQPQFDDAQLTAELRSAPVAVIADDARLRQVLINLLTNAVKFTPPGGRVLVEVGSEGSEAVLAISDTGPGIPSDELPHIFDRFWRGRAAAGRTGSGIGLAVVAALVEAHGGTVAAGSGPGGGAWFTVRLPAG